MFTNLGNLIYTNMQPGNWYVTKRDGPNISEDSWDTMTVELTGIFPGASVSSLANSAPGGGGWIGYRPGSARMWGQRVRFKEHSREVVTACLELKGFAQYDKPAKIKLTNGTEQQQATNINFNGGLYPKLRTLVPVLQVERIYQHTGDLDLSVIGQAIDPPDAPDNPFNPWTVLPDPEFRIPNGWVLSSRDPEYLPGVSHTQAALVRDVFSYIFPMAP